MVLGSAHKVRFEEQLVLGGRVGVAEGEVVGIRKDGVFDAADAFVEFGEALHLKRSLYNSYPTTD